MVEALCRCPRLEGDRVALISDGGGHATVLADSLGLAGFKLPNFAPKTQRALASFLPVRAAISNPLDFAGVVESDPSVLPRALEVCLMDPEVDAAVVAGHFGGYHRIGGADLECAEIAAALGDKHTLLMRNHGPVTVGKTMRDAFILMRDLETACKLQLQQQAAGLDPVMPSTEVLDRYVEQRKSHNAGRGGADWPAWLRRLDQIDPSYAQ